MIFLLTLLGSMVVCEAYFCGDLRQALTATTQEVRHRQERASLLIVTHTYGATGRDYRWE
ncbi:MAG: hypothetical protein ACR2JW_17660 [Thermomicrobiales bacterium]